jgi:hypothetical protein
VGVVGVDRGQAGDAGHVDDAESRAVGRVANAARHFDEQVGAAGHDARGGAVLGLQAQGFIQGLG